MLLCSLTILQARRGCSQKIFPQNLGRRIDPLELQRATADLHGHRPSSNWFQPHSRGQLRHQPQRAQTSVTIWLPHEHKSVDRALTLCSSNSGWSAAAIALAAGCDDGALRILQLLHLPTIQPLPGLVSGRLFADYTCEGLEVTFPGLARLNHVYFAV